MGNLNKMSKMEIMKKMSRTITKNLKNDNSFHHKKHKREILFHDQIVFKREFLNNKKPINITTIWAIKTSFFLHWDKQKK
ncbi:hypothetical protein BpHYR1_054298 [Brachionus plicatilis]|uniref:Uncharacterized protein n=1 Tax=Brachionus plicatilis TaxID=10195 RepID=A0A3M7QV05_BRAPC|nr:hypothetical protein BpHYR1_054298 [Brachionus plicatilis]